MHVVRISRQNFRTKDGAAGTLPFMVMVLQPCEKALVKETVALNCSGEEYSAFANVFAEHGPMPIVA